MRIVSVAIAAAMALTSVAPALAQDSDCTCVTTAENGQRIGEVPGTKGNVLASGANDYVAAQAGTPIALGSEIVVQSGSSADVLVGATCRLRLGAETTTRISSLANGNICVASHQSAPAGGSTAGSTIPLGPILGVGAAGGLILALALGQGDDPVSK